MKDFYLNYELGRGQNIFVKTNLPKSMLIAKDDYNEEWMFKAISAALHEINAMGDEAKALYQKLCEENGELLYNAAMVYYGINRTDPERKYYDKYAEFNSMTAYKVRNNMYAENDTNVSEAKRIKFKLM